MSKISVKSLGQGSKQGWLTKQGGSIKTWKKRWFVLKGDTLFYFKTQKDQDVTGSIHLEPTSTCAMVPEKSSSKKHFFTVTTQRRNYSIWGPDEQTAKAWVKVINEKIAESNGQGPSTTTTTTTTTTTSESPSEDKSTPPPSSTDSAASTPSATTKEPAKEEVKEDSEEDEPEPTPKADPKPTGGDSDTNPRQLLAAAKNAVSFLKDEESKVLEFWQIWVESIPPSEEIGLTGIEFHVSTSATMDKLTWRTAGPQNIFIQKMVDFFWNVGAPESEIDRLNDVGALINPMKIGSWIDMSSKGGMDGGWYFPVEIPLKMAIEAADPGDPSKLVTEWADKYSVQKCFSVGRDMGAAPPRQTEIRVRLPGSTFDAQLNVALEAYKTFGIDPPKDALPILKAEPQPGLSLSIITSSEGFVRLGLMYPNPSTSTVLKLCELMQASNTPLAAFEGSMRSKGPVYAELQYLRPGFGYGVYREENDLVLHYFLGEEQRVGDKKSGET